MNRMLALVAAVFLGGCATIIEGTSQPVTVATPGADGANCTLSSPDGTYYLITPGTVTVEKSKHDISVLCKKEGYSDGAATLASNFEGWTLGNIIFGGIIGVGVDAISGALNDYQGSITIPMQRKVAAAVPLGEIAPAAGVVAPPAAMTDYSVRLGAYESADGAQQGWTDIWGQYWRQLSGVQPQLVSGQAAGGQPQFQLVGTGLTRERAQNLCFVMRQSGQPCEAARF